MGRLSHGGDAAWMLDLQVGHHSTPTVRWAMPLAVATGQFSKVSLARSPVPTNLEAGSSSDHLGGRRPHAQCSISQLRVDTVA